MSGLRSSFTRKMAGNWDAQSHDQIKSNKCKQNSPRIVVSWTAPVVLDKPWIDDCWWRGSKNFYHSVWEPPIMYVVWKILGTLGCYVLLGLDAQNLNVKERHFILPLLI